VGIVDAGLTERDPGRIGEVPTCGAVSRGRAGEPLGRPRDGRRCREPWQNRDKNDGIGGRWGLAGGL